jgi:hypothetical protein
MEEVLAASLRCDMLHTRSSMAQDPLARIEQALQEIRVGLATAPANPKTREHRARLSTFERALMNFSGRVPTREQTAALLEGVLELHGRVFEARPPTSVRSVSNPALRAILTNPRVSVPTVPGIPAQGSLSNRPPHVASRPPSPRSITPSMPPALPSVPPASTRGK